MPPVIRYAGFAEESEFAESPAPAAIYHVDIASATLDAPTDSQIVFPGGLGRGAVTHRPGAYSPTGNVVQGTDIRTIGWLLKWALGGYEYTDEGGSGDFNLHEIYASDNNQLPSFAARIGKDLFEHVFSGCGINSLQIQSENQFVMATADIIASRDARANIQPIDELLLPDEYPLAFHELTVTRAATNISCDVRSLQLNIGNGLSAVHGQGSRHPCHQIAGEREVTLTMTLLYDSLDHLQAYWGGTNGPSAEGSDEFGLELGLDAGDDGRLDIAIPRSIYTTVPQQPSGRTEITQGVSIRAFVAKHTLADSNTEVRSELLASLQNNHGEMTAS